MCFLEEKAKVMRGMKRRRERREGKEKEKVRKRMIWHKNHKAGILSRKKYKISNFELY